MAEIIPGDGLQSTLVNAITTGATSLTIQTADYPSWPATGTYRCVLFNDAANGPWEIVTVTGGQGTATLTVTRASEAYRGTQTAQAWASGTTLVPVLTQGGLATLLAGGGGGIKKIFDYVASTDIWNGVTLTADTWINFDTPKTITIDDPNALIEIHAQGAVFMRNSGAGKMRIQVDGTTNYDISGNPDFTASTGGNLMASAGALVIGPLSVGTHTLQVQGISRGATGTGYCRALAIPNSEFFTLRVLQLPTPQSRIATPPAVLGSKVLLDWVATTDIWNSQAITQNTWTDIPTSTQQFTVDDPTANVEVTVWGSVQVTSPNTGSFATRVTLDGTTTKPLGSIASAGGDYGNALGGAGLVSLGPLSLGVHSVKVQVYATMVSAQSDMRPATYPVQHQFGIRVFQRAATVTGPLSPGGSAGDKLLLDWAATTDITGAAISATTWTDTFTAQTFTVDDATAEIEIAVTGCVRVGGGTAIASSGTRLMIDGAITKPLGMTRMTAAGDRPNALSGTGLVSVTGLAAGPHTIKVQAWIDSSAAGANDIYCRAATSNPPEQLGIRVWQRPTVYRGGSVPGARMSRSANQAVSANVTTPVQFTAVTFDTDNITNLTADATRFTIRTPGKYLAIGSVNNPGTTGSVSVMVNGTQQESGGAGGGSWASVAAVLDLKAGDYVQFNVWSGSAINITQIFASVLRQGDTLAPQYPTPGSKLLLNYVETQDLANNAVITANAWNNVGTAKSFTVDDPTAIVWVETGGYSVISGPSGGQNIGLALLIDGATRYMVGGARADSGLWGNIFAGSTPVPITGLAVGPHTVQVQFNPTAATNWYLMAATAGVQYSFYVRAWQQPQQSSSYGAAVTLLLDITPTATADVVNNWSLAANTWTDVPNSGASFVVTDPNAVIQLTVSASITSPDNGNYHGCNLVVDGTITKRLFGAVAYGEFFKSSAVVDIAGLGVGTHTFKLQLWTSVATTVYCRTGSGAEFLNYRVLQLSQGAQPPAPQYGFEVILPQTQASVTLPISGSLPQSFRDIRITWQARGDNASNATNLRLRLNGDSGTNYNWQQVYASGTGLSTTEHLADTSFGVGDVACANAPANATGSGRISLPNYSGTTFRKDVVVLDGVNQNDTAGNILTEHVYGAWKSTAAITSITLFPNAGNFIAGSKFTLILEGPPVSPPGIPGPGASPIKGPEVKLANAQASVILPVSGQLLQNYRHLYIKWQARGDVAAVATSLRLRLNGDAGANYNWQEGYSGNTATNAQNVIGDTSLQVCDIAGNSAPAGATGSGRIEFENYSGTDFRKDMQALGGVNQGDAAGSVLLETFFGEWKSTAAIVSITLFPSAGNFVTGSVFTLYYEP